MTKLALLPLSILMVLGLNGRAAAHNQYKEVTPATPVEDAWSGNHCWADGTRPELGDSHDCLGSGDFFYKFHLAEPSLVTVTVSTVDIPGLGAFAGLDPAFTLYRGLMGLEGHDDASYDPLNPLDDDTFLPIASRVDAAPPKHVYTPHDGFRDTLDYSTTGGLGMDGYPLVPYAGQFDALGDWSMANGFAVIGEPTVPSQCPIDECPDGNPVGDWAKIYYVAHRNEHAGVTTPDTTTEVLADEPLDAGDYTIIVGGGCPQCDTGGFFGGRIEIAVAPSPALSSDLLPGKAFTLRSKVGAENRSALSFSVKDPAVTIGAGNGSGDDPTLVGGTVRIHSINGAFDDVYTLPPGNWALIGKPGQGKGYKYKDKAQAAGPITGVTISAGKVLNLTGKGAGLARTLDPSPGPVRVTLTLGGHRYCLRFGGTTKWKAGASFTAKNALAPETCAP